MRAVYLPTALQPAGTLPADVAAPRATAAGESPAHAFSFGAEHLAGCTQAVFTTRPPSSSRPNSALRDDMGKPGSAEEAKGKDVTATSWAERAEKLIDAPLDAMQAFEAEWHRVYARRFIDVALAQDWALCEITAHTTPDAISDAFLFNAEPHGFDPALTADADVRQAREMME